MSELGTGSLVNNVFKVQGKGGVLIRNIHFQYLKVSILVHSDKGGRCDRDVSVEFMKLVSALFQIASTYCQNIADSKGSIEVGKVTVPENSPEYCSAQYFVSKKGM